MSGVKVTPVDETVIENEEKGEEKSGSKSESDPEGPAGNRDRSESAESVDSMEDLFDVNYDPRDPTAKTMLRDESKAMLFPNGEPHVTLKGRVRVFCEDPHSSSLASVFHMTYGLIILGSVLAFCTETLNFKGQPKGNNLSVEAYGILEIIFTILFTLDIIIRARVAERVCCCGSRPQRNAMAPPFFLDIMVLFDILSVLPYPFKEAVVASGLSADYPWLSSSVRVLSICRILRIFKVTRNFDGAKVLFVTMKNSVKPLTVSFIVLIAVMVIVSAILFFVEPCYASDCVFSDQLNAAYFLVITLTTIGYGDQIPATPPGKVVAVLIAFLGSFYMAMPLAIIGSKFEEAYKQRELEAVQKSQHRQDDLKDQLSHVSNKERRGRVLRLGFKITEIMQLSINASETESRFYMKAFPKKAEIMCNDISVLFEVALRGTVLDRRDSASNVLKSDLDPPQRSQGRVSRLNSFKAMVESTQEGRKRRKNTQESIRSHMMAAVAEAHRAKQSDKCRDKVWLIMNDTGAGQSAASRWFRNVQLVVVALSIGIVALETLPELNVYGPRSRLCKQVINHFCTYYVQPEVEKGGENAKLARQMNPGCFPSWAEVSQGNSTERVHYGGCILAEGDTDYVSSCSFPMVEAALTCTSELISETTTENNTAAGVTTTHVNISGVKYLADNILHKDKTGHELVTHRGVKLYSTKDAAKPFLESTHFEPLLAFDPKWPGLDRFPSPSLTPICERTQCVDNEVTNDQYPFWFFIGECFFIVCFTGEVLVRMFVMRSCRRFFLDFANIIDISAAAVALGEIVWIPLGWGKPAYEVWGMSNLMDPATFRVTRVLVAIRFISLQRQTGGLKVIGETLYRTWRKLIIPSVFFFLFTLLFAGVFYTFESGSLYQCSEEQFDQLENGFVQAKFIDPDHPARVDGFCLHCVEKSDLRVELDTTTQVFNKRDGSCRLLIKKSDDTMTKTMIEDMFDAMWTMIITMTTVGYGGKYPRTMTGKFVAVVSAILGSLYMAMPLTIVGSKFYDIYEQIEQQRAKAQYKSAQLLHAKRKSQIQREKKALGMRRNHSARTLDSLKALKLGHVITLKRWVYRTKRKLEVQALTDEERIQIVKYLKKCHKLCTLSSFLRVELQEFAQMHTVLMSIISKHLIHRHADGIDTIEATLY